MGSSTDYIPGMPTNFWLQKYRDWRINPRIFIYLVDKLIARIYVGLRAYKIKFIPNVYV